MLAWTCSTTSSQHDRLRRGSPPARLPQAIAALLRAGLVQHHRELVAAQPGEQVRRLQLRQRAGEPVHHRPQQLVAGRVPEGVVDLLEVVEVDQRQREAVSTARAAGRRLGAANTVQRDVQRASVGGTGELVGERLLRGRRRARAAAGTPASAVPRRRPASSRASTEGSGFSDHGGAAARTDDRPPGRRRRRPATGPRAARGWPRGAASVAPTATRTSPTAQARRARCRTDVVVEGQPVGVDDVAGRRRPPCRRPRARSAGPARARPSRGRPASPRHDDRAHRVGQRRGRGRASRPRPGRSAERSPSMVRAAAREHAARARRAPR